MIEQEADDNADIIWGSVIRGDMSDEITVTVIATGFDSAVQNIIPQPRLAEPPLTATAAYAPSRAPQKTWTCQHLFGDRLIRSHQKLEKP